jgi:predicted outer membrane repeat protein
MLPLDKTARHTTSRTRPVPQSRKAFGRLAAVGLPMVFFAGTALSLVVTASPASAAGTTWYAYAGGGATSPVSCPKTTIASKKCTLAEALARAAAGSTIALATSGSKGHYVGNWAVNTGGTFVAQPLTIKTAPGISKPVLDGNHGKAGGCQTKICSGPVLTIGSEVHVDIVGITIENAASKGKGGAIENAMNGALIVSGSTFSANSAADGGAIDNGDKGGGLLTVTASKFIDNIALGDGGAIDNADKGSGIVTVSGSTFSANKAADGGAIDDGGNAGTGTVTLSSSTFYANSASDNGGAIDNGDRGSATLTVSGSTFSADSAHGDGGAIDNGDNGSANLIVSASTFSADTASVDGGAIDNANSGRGTLRVSVSSFSGNSASLNGGAIDTGDRGSAAASVSASTFAGNTAKAEGATIDNSDRGGTSAVWLAADIFSGTCDQPAGAWFDEGYNVATSSTCVGSTPPKTDAATSAPDLGPLGHNGGPTETMAPVAGSPAIGAVANGATATLSGTVVKLCPTTDQRGVSSAAGKACNAGSVQA